MKHDDPKLIDALAAEYVLGTLGGRARRRFERWRSREWHVERRVQAWEERLSGLALRLPPMRPSPHVWTQIEKRISRTVPGGVPPAAARARPAPVTPKRSPWQAIAAGIVLFAVLIGGYALYRDSGEPPQMLALATLTAEGASQPSWTLAADTGLRHVRAIVGAGFAGEAGKSYELWALPDNGSAPVSLGLMPVEGTFDRELTEAQRAALLGASKVAISEEPEGGSPTGAPTGPVIIVADRVKRA
jgi:anti-sigma-K factor RskA